MSTPEYAQPSPQHLEALALLADHAHTFTEDHMQWRVDPHPEDDKVFTALALNFNEDRVSDAIVRAMPHVSLPGVHQDPYYMYVRQSRRTPESYADNDRTQTFLSLQRSFRTSDVKGEVRLVAELQPGIVDAPQYLLMSPEIEFSTRDIEYEAYEQDWKARRRQAMLEAREDPGPSSELTAEERQAILREIKRREKLGFTSRAPEDTSRKLDPEKYLSETEYNKCQRRSATTEEAMEFARLVGSFSLFDIKASGDGLA